MDNELDSLARLLEEFIEKYIDQIDIESLKDTQESEQEEKNIQIKNR